MVYTSDVNSLISQWTKRIGDETFPQSYRDALFECCYELHNLLIKSFDEEIEARESFRQLTDTDGTAVH